ncbi:MAG: winged helix DNA-binding domain-containing protein [Frankiaceae bacterium]
MDVAQRRARLARRHHLAAEALADAPETVAADLVAVHSTDPASVYQELWARLREGDVATVSDALYERRSLIRLLAMRRTVFVTTRELAPVVQAACARDVAARERRKLLQWLAEAGVSGGSGGSGAVDVESWLRELEEVALAALVARGEASAAELAEDDARLRLRVTVGRGTRFEGRTQLSSRVLLLLAAEGRAVRGRPRGSWASTQYRWAPMAAWCAGWCDGGLPQLPAEQAEVELAARWLRAHGPATADDLRWWTGWTARQVRRALTGVAPVEVELDGGTGIALGDDLAPEPQVRPWGALLPPLDATAMGWRHRDWFLGPHAARVFDAAGNAGPTAWWDGRVVGGWAQRPDGEIVVTLLDDVGSDAAAVLDQQAEALAARMGPVRMSARARGRTDVERAALGQAGTGPDGPGPDEAC